MAPEFWDAADRVEHFLDARGKASNLDPEIIYIMWADNRQRELRTSDLRALVALARRSE